MRRRFVYSLTLLAVLPVLLCADAVHAQIRVPPDLLDEDSPRAQILLLGTFHFDDAGLDSYKPRFPLDVKTPERQREIEDIVDRLARFGPTRIAVERKPERQAQLDSLYKAYLAGSWTLPANEIYQIGFRLAKKLKHERVYAVDAAARTFFPGMTQAAWDSMYATYIPVDTVWDARYTKLYTWQDSIKTTTSLRDALHFMNSQDYVQRSRGAYVTGSFHMRKDSDYFGVDAATYWWNRNLRIFSNLQRLTRSPKERILMVVGAGHLALLGDAIRSSPAYNLVDAAAYLGTPSITRESVAWQQWQTFLTAKWSCAGAFANGTKLEADMSFAKSLGDNWLRYEHVDRAPGKFAASASWGFQSGTGKLISTMHDNFGGARRFDGSITADSLVWRNDATFAPASYSERFVFTREGEKLRMTWEVASDGGTWRMGDYLVCTRM